MSKLKQTSLFGFLSHSTANAPQTKGGDLKEALQMSHLDQQTAMSLIMQPTRLFLTVTINAVHIFRLLNHLSPPMRLMIILML
uniref:Uncharacterized protein n=1 Tax=Amphimedon queenslandica TaxID=400682 RepID=A0A1X7SDY1_AMPQE